MTLFSKNNSREQCYVKKSILMRVIDYVSISSMYYQKHHTYNNINYFRVTEPNSAIPTYYYLILYILY